MSIKAYIRREVITPLVILAVLAVYIVSALRLSPPLVKGLPQESFFPLLIFILAVPAALMLLYRGVREVRRGDSVPSGGTFGVKPFLIALISALLILFFEPLGFAITAPLYVFCFMMIYDDKPQGIIRKIIYTLLITAVVYVLYVVVFNIRFPQIWQ
jgi:hypothetical protein